LSTIGGEYGNRRPEHARDEADLRQSAAQFRAEFQRGFDDVKKLLHDNKTELINLFREAEQRNREAVRARSPQ
jgi:hypothetical protein